MDPLLFWYMLENGKNTNQGSLPPEWVLSCMVGLTLIMVVAVVAAFVVDEYL